MMHSHEPLVLSYLLHCIISTIHACINKYLILTILGFPTHLSISLYLLPVLRGWFDSIA